MSKNLKKGKNRQTNREQFPASKIQKDYPSISACMIVRNEEEFLEKCLKSIVAYVDEIIIVDTGSTDNTVEIARRFTKQVYFHPWENSFSKAKNQAIEYATGDWIFFIDADEELMAGSGERIRIAVMDAKNADTIYVNIICSYASGSKKSLNTFQRLFKNNRKIHYEGSVHEQVIGGTNALYSSIELFHYGYDVDEKKARKKFDRTTDLIKKEIEKNPDNPINHHYLSASYYSIGMFKEASEEAVSAVDLSGLQNDTREVFAWSHYIAAMSFYYLDSLKKAEEYACKSLNKYPEHIDSYYILTIIALDEGRWDDVIKNGNTFLEKLEHINTGIKGRNILINTMNEGPAINTMIGHAYYQKGLLPEMEAYYKKAHDMAGEKWRTWLDTGTYHMDKSGDLVRARHFLDLAVGEAPDEHDVWYMRAKLNKKQGMSEDELACLERIVSIGTNDPFIFNRLLTLYVEKGMLGKAMDIVRNHDTKISANGDLLCRLAVLQLEKGQIESAIKCYMMALEKEPHLFEAWASLGEIMLVMNRISDAKTFLEKALSLKRNDIGIIMNLCDIASRLGDIHSVIKYTDLLLKELNLTIDRTLNNLNDLKAILDEIRPLLKDNEHYQNQINAIIERISTMKNQPAH